jgi:glycosyltransferase involved in cell wall biosynthesis
MREGLAPTTLVGVISDRMSSMKDLISIIIPAYNAERFIGRTLDSALNQTFIDIEVIVVNDGSTDKTQFIVEDFVANDGRVRLFNTINRSVATARNFSIENARGAYVAFLDADDLWHPTKIERQFKALSAHVSDSTWAGVYVFRRAIDDEDRVIGLGRVTMDCRGYVLARNLVLKFVGNGSSLLVRREAALAVGGFDPSYAEAGVGGCEDLDFELRLAAQYRIEAVRSFLVGYRIYEGNMSSDKVRMAKSMVATIAQHIKQNPSMPPRIRRWGMGAGYKYAYQNLRSAKEFGPAMRAYCMMLVNDPVLAIYIALKGFPIASPIVPTARKFLCMHPEAGLDSPIPAITRIREKELAPRLQLDSRLGGRVRVVNRARLPKLLCDLKWGDVHVRPPGGFVGPRQHSSKAGASRSSIAWWQPEKMDVACFARRPSVVPLARVTIATKPPSSRSASMATERQIAANRANAQKSTGPKTAAGRLKSSRNAYRHGLSCPLPLDPAVSEKLDAIAQALIREDTTEEQATSAAEFARAQLELLRIRAIRAEMTRDIDLS